MPGPWDVSPNQNLGMAAMLAQGVQTGLGAYQAQTQRNAEMAMKQEQMKAQADLNRLKMQKLQEEIAPIQFSAQKYQMIDKAATAGMIPDSVRNKAATELTSQIQTPGQIAFLNSMIDKKAQSKLQGMNPLDLSQAMGGGMSDVMTAQMPKPYPSAADNPAPPATAQYAPQSSGLDPKDPNSSFSMTPKEANFYSGIVKAKNQAGLGYANVQQHGDAATMQHQAAMGAIQAKMQASKDADELQYWKTQYLDETNRYLGDQKSATALTIADKNNATKITAAKAKPAGGKSAADPQEKSLLAVKQQKEKALSDATTKAPAGFSMETAPEKAARIQEAIAARDKADSDYQNYVAKRSGGRGQSAQAPARAAPGAQQGPKVLSGDAATIKSQARAMPEGVPYSTPSGTWVNRNGAPQQYVPQGRAPQSVPDDSYPVEQ